MINRDETPGQNSATETVEAKAIGDNGKGQGGEAGTKQGRDSWGRYLPGVSGNPHPPGRTRVDYITEAGALFRAALPVADWVAKIIQRMDAQGQAISTHAHEMYARYAIGLPADRKEIDVAIVAAAVPLADVHAARALLAQMRKQDALARPGGDVVKEIPVASGDAGSDASDGARNDTAG